MRDKKKILKEMKRDCPDYKEDVSRGKRKKMCSYIGEYSGRCFKNTNPLLPCKILNGSDVVGAQHQEDFFDIPTL